MKERKISVVALSNHDFSSFEEKLKEAARWIGIAASQGGELVVLPEALDKWCGDGAGNAKVVSMADRILDDWESQTKILRDAAVHYGLAVVVPVVHREGSAIYNSFFLISKEGVTIGRYDKRCPTPPELDSGIVPGNTPLMEWEGIRIGGAICFDTCFPWVINKQAEEGAELILVPSLWPGGTIINAQALQHSLCMAVSYPAWSRIIDMTGKEVVGGGYRHETLRFGFGAPVYTAALNFDRIALYGNENQFKIVKLQKEYGTRLSIIFDQENCTFFIESRDGDLSIQEVVKAHGLIPAKDYFAECEKRIQAIQCS